MDARLKGATVLIIEPEIESALDLQDLLADEGATVLTAYRKVRALELVQLSSVKGIVIERSAYDQLSELRGRICERRIPHVVYRRQSPAETTVAKLREVLHQPSISAAAGSTPRKRVGERDARNYPNASLQTTWPRGEKWI